jgi:hypothetical protein
MYTASSVVNAIRESIIRNNCSCDDLNYIKCPKDRCNINPENCSPGNDHSCPQKINVFDIHCNLLIIIFLFTISNTNHDGFVDEDDSALSELFNRSIIDRASLDTTTVIFN